MLEGFRHKGCRTSIPRRYLHLLVLLGVFGSVPARAQSPPALTGVLAVDLLRSGETVAGDTPVVHRVVPTVPGLKSPFVAGGLSALVPGAGQIYADAPWWRAALYGALEAAGWTIYAVYNGKGNDATTQFEQFADSHWSVIRYIDWLRSNYQSWPDQAVDKQAASDALQSIHIQTEPGAPEWAGVDFAQLNKLERAVHEGFSHTLPAHGQQQYYEEIGKYAQYRSGWDDHRRDGDTLIYDPSRVTDRNRGYMDMRATANDYLSYAGTAVGGIVLNHLASMLDAILQARHVNMSVRAEVQGALQGPVPTPATARIELALRF